MQSREWNLHYTRGKSALSYPDENLVRLLSHELASRGNKQLRALDTGCGSGRHLFLLKNLGIDLSVGTDFSYNALDICRAAGERLLINCDNRALPFRDSSFDIVIAWGSLHYSGKDEAQSMVNELLRITAAGGVLLSTLRRDNDTYLRTGEHLGNNVWRTKLQDLDGSTVSFYCEDEVKKIFSGFSDVRYGFMERSIVGDTGKVISHWVVSAKRQG